MKLQWYSMGWKHVESQINEVIEVQLRDKTLDHSHEACGEILIPESTLCHHWNNFSGATPWVFNHWSHYSSKLWDSVEYLHEACCETLRTESTLCHHWSLFRCNLQIEHLHKSNQWYSMGWKHVGSPITEVIFRGNLEVRTFTWSLRWNSLGWKQIVPSPTSLARHEFGTVQ